jgi:uroporphyrinogen-III synthase
MRLLVTRPQPDADETAARLRALGHTAIVDPLLTITIGPPPVGVERPAALLVTSRNALRALLGWPDAAGWRDVPVFAVGPESADLARASGFADVRTGDGDARALADLVAHEFEPAAGVILYPAARDRAARIDETLTAMGFSVRRIEAYRASAATHFGVATEVAVRQGALDGVLLYSRRTAAAFLACAAAAGLTPQLTALTFFAISAEAATPLRALPGLAVRVATRPDGESLFALLPPA